MAQNDENEETIRKIRALEQHVAELSMLVGEVPVESLPDGDLQLLRCRVGNEMMAVSLEDVEEVVMMARLAQIPDSPAWLAGSLNLRGSATPVIDVLARVTSVERPPTASDLIVICNTDHRRVGLIVQEVFEVLTTDRSTLQPASFGVLHAAYLLGILIVDHHPIQVISLRQLVSSSDLEPEPESNLPD